MGKLVIFGQIGSIWEFGSIWGNVALFAQKWLYLDKYGSF